MTATQYVYRIRSMEKLLSGRHEIEKQQIYLSAPEDLNDPMEGYQNLLWSGDGILWENLLRHYILCLFWAVQMCLFLDDASFSEPKVSAELTEDSLQTDALRKIYYDICDRFLLIPGMSGLSERLASSGPLRRNGLRLVLSTIHLHILAAVTDELRARNLLPAGWVEISPPNMDKTLSVLFDTLRRALDQSKDAEVELSALALAHARDQNELVLRFNSKADPSAVSERKKTYLLFRFPDIYVTTISDSLLYLDWRTACFSGNCTNASMWASYGDQHRGAALMFRVERTPEGKPFIPLLGPTSWSSSSPDPGRGPIQGLLHKVRYESRAPEVDFFRFIGRLPAMKVLKTWHSDRGGQVSPIVKAINDDRGEWQRKLWELFYEMSTTKLPDWAHEDEYRIVVPDLLEFHRLGHRTLEFPLSSLEGIVFGLRTNIADKLTIMKLIHAKCVNEGRSEFAFHQMVYRYTDGTLVRI